MALNISLYRDNNEQDITNDQLVIDLCIRNSRQRSFTVDHRCKDPRGVGQRAS